MFKTQIKFQRVLCLVALICAAVTFVYALGIMTDVYNLLRYVPFPEDPYYAVEVEGAWVYYEMQPFNEALIAVGIALILIAVVLFITNTHSRRKYYIGNYVAVGLYTGASLASTIWAYINIAKYKTAFLQVDFETWKDLVETVYKNDPYTESTFWFDIGFVAYALPIIASILLVINVIWKVSLMKQERKLIEEGKALNQG